jgi:hypothetical protein
MLKLGRPISLRRFCSIVLWRFLLVGVLYYVGFDSGRRLIVMLKCSAASGQEKELRNYGA